MQRHPLRAIVPRVAQFIRTLQRPENHVDELAFGRRFLIYLIPPVPSARVVAVPHHGIAVLEQILAAATVDTILHAHAMGQPGQGVALQPNRVAELLGHGIRKLPVGGKTGEEPMFRRGRVRSGVELEMKNM